MLLQCTLLELQEHNLLKRYFDLKDWTPQSVTDAVNAPIGISLRLRIMIDHVYGVELPDSEQIKRYTDTIPHILATESVTLTKEQYEALSIRVNFT